MNPFCLSVSIYSYSQLSLLDVRDSKEWLSHWNTKKKVMHYHNIFVLLNNIILLLFYLQNINIFIIKNSIIFFKNFMDNSNSIQKFMEINMLFEFFIYMYFIFISFYFYWWLLVQLIIIIKVNDFDAMVKIKNKNKNMYVLFKILFQRRRQNYFPLYFHLFCH
jgi:hypothetical protein